ncbi:MAG TPA: hypothetical protein VIV60_13915 [Polyangiaceae bacterium]
MSLMAQVDSANHGGSAFARELPTSSHEATAPLDALVVAWAIGLVLYTLLEGSLLVDVSGFMRAAELFDRPWAAWLLVGVGYACILNVGNQLRHANRSRSDMTQSTLLSILALVSFSFDTMLLRWPWLVGSADAKSRLTVWSATLSCTWHGMPVFALTEAIGVGLIVAQAFVGLREVALRRYHALTRRRAYGVGLAIGLLTQLLASAVVVALATGRR